MQLTRADLEELQAVLRSHLDEYNHTDEADALAKKLEALLDNTPTGRCIRCGAESCFMEHA